MSTCSAPVSTLVRTHARTRLPGLAAQGQIQLLVLLCNLCCLRGTWSLHALLSAIPHTTHISPTPDTRKHTSLTHMYVASYPGHLGTRLTCMYTSSHTQLTSQNPYTEMFIGKPYVYTVDIGSSAELTAALKEISTKPVRPVCSSRHIVQEDSLTHHTPLTEPSSVRAIRVHLRGPTGAYGSLPATPAVLSPPPVATCL